MTRVRHLTNHPQAGTQKSDPHVLLAPALIGKQWIAPGSLEHNGNTRIIVHVAAMGHHHAGTGTSNQSTPLLMIVGGINPMAIVRIRGLALDLLTQVDARPMTGVFVIVATTRMR
jgi:hypothetical protein